MRTIAAGPVPSSRPRSNLLQKAFLACGLLSSLWYLVMNVVVPIQWREYNVASQTVSELSAIEAPTRVLWVQLGAFYTLLGLAFAWGVLGFEGQPKLRIAGTAILLQAAMGPFWPPMHLRGVAMTMTDTMHLVFAGATLILMVVTMAYGAAQFGRRFKLYTIATIALWLVFGVLTGMEAPGIATGDRTPFIGIWERINVGLYMLWVTLFSVKLTKSA